MDILTVPNVTVAAAVLAGATVVAYRHPSRYLRLFLLLSACLVILESLAGTWEWSGHTLYVTLLPLIPADKVREAEAVIDAHSLWSEKLLFLLVACWAYLFFLLFLPRILDLKQKPKKPSPS